MANSRACEAFQSTPPRGEATSSTRICTSMHRFQSTPPRGEATRRSAATARRIGFQSTPPRGEATRALLARRALHGISIHASPRGGDMSDHVYFDGSVISIHASPRGGDAHKRSVSRWLTHFNPRLPEGRRLAGVGLGGYYMIFQSTPPRGEATTCQRGEDFHT